MSDGRRDNLHNSESSGLPILPPAFSSAGTGREGFVLEHHRQPAFEVPPLSSTVYGILVALGGPFKAEITRGGRRRRYRLMPGDVSVFPYGFSIDGAYVEPCEFLLLCLRPSAIERAAACVVSAGRPEITPRIGAADPLAAQMLNDLLRELQTGPAGGRPYVDALVGTLSVHLVRHYSASPRAGQGQTGGMSDYVLSGAIDFINDSLERDLSLAEIARAAGLSPPRFARAFKAATGKAVHQYVDERRVEKAKPLLMSGELPPEEVARRVGFGSPRRFAAVFLRLTSVSPQSYRQQTRP
ncbi:MAG: AraC family transcriptional regulator [Acidobacteriota bacterium]|nr:AraC family transcriptional regulator [Acidobacteriota bacterium]